MNIHNKPATRAEAEAALALLRDWAAKAPADEVAALDLYPALSAKYPADFVVDAAYKAGLPDLQNGPSSLIKGERTLIQHVGISNCRLPIR